MNNDLMPNEMPKAKKRKLPLFIRVLLIALSGICVVTGAFLCYLFFRSPAQNPFGKTANAVFPALSVIGEMENSGSITLRGEIASDLCEEFREAPLALSMQYRYREKDWVISTGIGGGEDSLRADLIHKQDVLYLQSNLMEKPLSANAQSWKQDLLSSPLAPGSGTEYAVSRELYDLLASTWDSYQKDVDTPKVLETSLKNIWQAVEKNIAIEESIESVALLDGEVEAKVMTLALNENTLIDLAGAVWAEMGSNTSFREIVIEHYGLRDDPELTDGEIYEILQEQIKEFKVSAVESGFQCTLRLAVYKGYWVAATATWNLNEEDLWGDVQKKAGNAAILFAKNPAQSARCKITVNATVNNQETLRLEATLENDPSNVGKSFLLDTELIQRMEDENGEEQTYVTGIRAECRVDLQNALTASVKMETAENGGPFVQGFLMELSGSYTQSTEKIEIGIHGLRVQMGTETLLDLNRSKLEIVLNAAQPTIQAAENAQALFSMTDRELAQVRGQMHEAMTSLSSKVNEAIGYTLLQYGYEFREEEYLSFENSPNAYAFDPQTNRLFVLIKNSSKNFYVEIYNTNTMEKVGTIYPELEPAMLFAGDGYLVMVGMWKRGLEVYGGESMEMLHKIETQTKFYDGVMDKTDLIYVDLESDRIFHVDVVTGEIFVVESSLPDGCSIKFYPNRAQRTVSIKDESYPSKNYQCNYQFDTRTKQSYSGPTWSLPNYNHSGYRLSRVIYGDKDYMICYEYRNSDNQASHFMYAATGGAPVGEIISNELYEVMPLGNGGYLICDCFYSAGPLSFTKYTVQQKWSINLPIEND